MSSSTRKKIDWLLMLMRTVMEGRRAQLLFTFEDGRLVVGVCR